MYDSLYGLEEFDIFNIEDFTIHLRSPIKDTENSDYNITISFVNEITRAKILDKIPATDDTFTLSSDTLKSIKKGIYFLDVCFENKTTGELYTDRSRVTLKGD